MYTPNSGVDFATLHFLPGLWVDFLPTGSTFIPLEDCYINPVAGYFSTPIVRESTDLGSSLPPPWRKTLPPQLRSGSVFMERFRGRVRVQHELSWLGWFDWRCVELGSVVADGFSQTHVVVKVTGSGLVRMWKFVDSGRIWIGYLQHKTDVLHRLTIINRHL